MKLRINQIAHSIRTGHSFRERIENDPSGDCLAIQPKDISPSNTNLVGQPQKVRSSDFPEKQLLQKGDVLLLAKGNRNYAWVFNLDEKAVTTSLFFVIRPDTTKVNPEYLAWYINQETIQGALHAAKAGTSVTNLSISDLSELEIKIPSIYTQNQLVNLYKLWQVEKTKTLQLVEEKDRFYNNLVLAEIEREREVPPYTDDYAHWSGYLFLSNHCTANIKLKQHVPLKGYDKPTNEIRALIIDMVHYSRTIDKGAGATESYAAVKEWKVFKFNFDNLQKWNDGNITREEKEKDLVDVIPHSLIQSITMIDQQGNKVDPRIKLSV